MSELADQSGLGGGLRIPAAAAALSPGAKKPMGADRFRALTERLKKPIPPLVLAPAAPVPQPVPPPAAPVLEERAAPAPAPEPAVEIAVAPVVEPVAEDLPVPAIEVLPEIPAAPLVVEPELPPETVEASPQAEIEPLPEVVAPPPPAVPEPELEPEVALAPPPAAPEPLPPILAAPLPPPASKPAGKAEAMDPLQRRLSGLFNAPSAPAPAPALQLPEILPPPPPPPPPEPLPEAHAGLDLSAPSMEEVQQRLREDATARLEQLDLENVWRQVLSLPTVEERAQYLKEAAEFAALEGNPVALVGDVPPEHDLSRIEPLAADGDEAGALFKTYEPGLPTLSDEESETAEVARSLLDMMSMGTSTGLPQERALASDTLLRLVPKLALKPLVMLAERLSIMENPPNLIVGKLIRDPRPEVSGPLLENCVHVTENDLVTVAEEENPGKRRMLARRRKLSPSVSAALIATRDPSVVLTLVRNTNSEIDHEGFAALIEYCGDMPEILAPLSTRADLSAPYAFELFWKSPPQLRRFLLSRFLTDSETLTKILKITLSADGEEGAGDRLSTGEMVETLSRACKGKVEAAATKLAEALKVGVGCIMRILTDNSGEAMVVMLKVAGFPRGNLGDLLAALKRGDLPLLDEERNIEELQVMFDTLSSNKARILLTYWDWAVKKSGPYAPVH